MNALSLDGIVLDVDVDHTNTNGAGTSSTIGTTSTTGTTTNGNHHCMGMGMCMVGLGIGGQRFVAASVENNENGKIILVDTNKNQLIAPSSSGDRGGGGVSRSEHGVCGLSTEMMIGVGGIAGSCIIHHTRPNNSTSAQWVCMWVLL